MQQDMEISMKTKLLLTAALLVVSVFMVASTSAQSRGDVTIKINPPDNKVYSGETNTFEFWYRNDGALKGMVVPFFVTSNIPTFSWLQPYGNTYLNTGGPHLPILRLYGDAIGTFDLGGFRIGFFPTIESDTLALWGAALASPLPAHLMSTKIGDMKLIIPADTIDYPEGFCIDNIFMPPSSSWKFDEGGAGGAYAPDYNGLPNPGGSGNPDAPPICFDIVRYPTVRGDADHDGMVDISDVLFIRDYIFYSGAAPFPRLAGDANCDESVDISDVVYLIAYIFQSGPAPC
jgi:hypothetical protein